MKNNITLIGMPGSGKSTVGVVLAKRLGRRFVDSDLVIQDRHGKLLHELITEYGVKGFWQIESDVNASLDLENSIIATGGSACYEPEGMQHLREISTVVYLKLPYKEVEKRLGDLNARGVTLQPGQTLRDLYDERTPLYEKYADLIIDCSGKMLRDVVAFVSHSKGMHYIHPFTFNGVRSLIGAAGILVYILISRKIAGDKAAKLDWKLNVRAGLLCGIFLTIASTLQQFGIKYTSVGKAGFITTLYIIFVPMFGVFLKKKVAPVVWAAAGMAAVGMYLLCMTESLRLGAGDIMVFLCAIAFAIQIMTVDHYAARIDGAVVSCIQFTVCGVVCCIGALIWGQPTFGQIQEGLGALLYAGVLSCGVGYTLQIVGQKGLNPTVAALIMSLESVIATISGWIAYKIGFLSTDQTLTPRQIAGCVIVFAAVILVQLPPEWFRFGKK